MSEIDWKNKLRKIRETAKKASPEDSEDQPKVKFPWFIFFIALINDLLDYLDPILHAVTGGIWLAISETIGNVIDAATFGILWFWSYFSKSKSDPLTKYLTALVIELIPFGDFVPSWTAVVIAHYLKEKSLAKMPISATT